MQRPLKYSKEGRENNKMTAKEFFYLVAEMRDAQRRYFKDRDQQVLRAARKLEGLVDLEIRRVKEILDE